MMNIKDIDPDFLSLYGVLTKEALLSMFWKEKQEREKDHVEFLEDLMKLQRVAEALLASVFTDVYNPIRDKWYSVCRAEPAKESETK